MPSTITDRIDGVSTSVAVKAPVRIATTTNITLSGEQTLQGVSLVENDRVLVAGQTSSIDNGIYIVQTNTWTRAPDFDGARDAVKGTVVWIEAGTDAEEFYILTSSNPITIGTSNITWEIDNIGAAAQAAAEAAQTAAEAAKADAETARDEAEAAAASLNLPGIVSGDAKKLLQVKTDETGLQHSDYATVTATNHAVDSVGTDAYAVTLAPAPTTYTTGMEVSFTVGTANNGASTLNVNSLGAKSIRKNYDQTLETGDLVAGQVATVRYDGTRFQLQSPSADGGTINNLTDIGEALDAANDLISVYNASAGRKRKSTIQRILDLFSTTYNLQKFTSSGTWNKPSGLVAAIVIVIGGGGGSGGTGGTTTFGSHISCPGGESNTSASPPSPNARTSSAPTVSTGSGLGIRGDYGEVKIRNINDGSDTDVKYVKGGDSWLGVGGQGSPTDNPPRGYGAGVGNAVASSTLVAKAAAAGSQAFSLIQAASLGSTETVTIGAGGSDGSSGNDGAPGIVLILEIT